MPELACVRITAYEESGKFIGHRVLPVIGLCPGYRHVNLRNECGQTLPLATLFLCIVVKDYVPDGLSDFADALANPIKYQSQFEKRAEQLAVLTDDADLIPSVCDSSSSAAAQAAPSMATAASGLPGNYAGKQSKTVDSLPRGQQSFSEGGLENNGPDSERTGGGASASIGGPEYSGAGGGGLSASSVPTNSQPNVSILVTGVDGASSGGGGGGGASSSSKSVEAIEADAMKAEPLECILAHKVVREKRQEMEKKLESLRKKHDKEKLRICSSSPKAGGDASDNKKSKFNMGNKLVKRLSSKSIDPTLQVPPCPSDLLDVVEEGGGGDGEGPDEDRPNIKRSHSERLLSACREFASSYREIQEKYHESIYNAAEKQLRNSQASQMKRLKVSEWVGGIVRNGCAPFIFIAVSSYRQTLLEKETSDVMRKLQVDRRNEVKALTQKHRDRDELVRMKREVASSLVGRGVTERLRLAQAFEKRREDLQRQHDLVKTTLQDHRSKVSAGQCDDDGESVEFL